MDVFTTPPPIDPLDSSLTSEASPADEFPDGHQEAMSERVRALRLDKGEILYQRKRHRIWWLLLVLILLLGFAVYVYRVPLEARIGHLRSVPELAAVTASEEPSVPIVLNTTGYVIAHSIVRVGSRVPGTVVELPVDEGATVEKGQLLAKLDDQRYKAELDHAKGALASAEAQLAEARNGPREEDILKAKSAVDQAQAHRDVLEQEYSRSKKLEGTISQTEAARSKSNYLEARAAADQAAFALKLVELGVRKERIDALTAEVASAKALVEKAQYFYDGTRITSPVRGKLVERTVEVGETLRMEALDMSLCRVADFSRMEVEIDIPERDLAEIRQKQPCRVITEAYPDRQYRGQLDWLAPIFNRQRAIRRAKITILNPDEQLVPDMNCQVQILAREMPEGKEKVLRLPVAAIDHQKGKAFVYVVENDKAHLREVKIESAGSSTVEVLAGLRNGEVVLLPGKSTVRDGQQVRVRLTQSERSS